MKAFLALLFSLVASAALAQNPTCPTRPLGDSSNACASTAFVINQLAAISFPVASVSNADGTLTIAPTTGAVVASLNLAHANTWTALQTLTSGPSIANTTSQFSVTTYDGSTTSGKAGMQITNTDNGAQSALEKYTTWISADNQGTGDGTPAATTFALGLSAIKTNWQTTTVLGEFVGLNIAVRGGHNNALVSGDTAGLTTNVAASNSNNFIASYEGVTNYFPAGSTVSASVLSVNTQVGTLLPSAVASTNGFYTQAQNGILGTAFFASNLGTNGTAKFGTASKWNSFLQYLFDDGTHTPYVAFSVGQTGGMTLAGFGAVNTNQKTLRVGGSATNDFEIVNAAASGLVLRLTDAGLLGFPQAAAFVTAGATGPATLINRPTAATGTAQNKWLVILDSGGVATYVPVWQ
jgi:hypothetical protein